MRRPAARGGAPPASAPEAENAVPVVEEDDVAQLGKLAAHLVEHRRAMSIAAVLAREEESLGARLTEHVGELLGAVRRVDRHQHEARERGAELEEDPLRTVRRPHRDVIAGREAQEERARRGLGLGQELGVGPAPAARRIGVAFDQRDAIGLRRRRRRAGARPTVVSWSGSAVSARKCERESWRAQRSPPRLKVD